MKHNADKTLAYTYDMLNRRTGETRSSAPARTFGYDLTSQLTAVNQSGGNATFAYDAVGNRTIVTGAPGAGSYTANSLNQYTGAGDGGALGCGANGNLATGGGWTYTHDGKEPAGSVLVIATFTQTPSGLKQGGSERLRAERLLHRKYKDPGRAAPRRGLKEQGTGRPAAC